MTTFKEVMARRDWENPQSIQVNRMAAHSPLHGFKSQNEALNQQSSQRVSLNGDWQFQLFSSPEEVPATVIGADTADAQHSDQLWSTVSDEMVTSVSASQCAMIKVRQNQQQR
ncbi:MAG: hypothetical protein JKY55_14535 [Aliivibrio sp.]|uniref:hypothetical protein n=1 Tax=Aliivibrio sp. TaxID=1872443 RepID=UPI001A4CAC69|nr:hypothetical protein [Aliivibrio sp.]